MKFRKEKFILTILFLQLLFLGMIVLELMGIEIPILRQVIGFIYLTFIPGLLIFSIIRIYSFNDVGESFLYIIGLSILFIMFVGFVVNLLYPLIGISKPISKVPLIITINSVIILLILILWFSCKELEFYFFNIKEIISPYTLSFSLLPFVSIFGAYLLNYYNNNTILLILYIMISLIPFLVAFDKIPSRIYPFVIWVISISLLFSVALSVRYLSGHLSDATLEYYFANIVKTEGFWNPSISRNKNAMLSIVMLHPIYSILLNLNLKDVFRIVYPLLFSFTPVTLYIAFSKQIDKRIAFYASFFFMSFYPFYVVLSRNTRTGLAELFLALFVLSMTNSTMCKIKKNILMIFFALAIIVSHYGVAYVFLVAIIFTSLFSILFKKHIELYKNNSTVNVNFTLLYITFAFAWYIYNSSGSIFETLIQFLEHLACHISKFFGPTSSYAVYALSREWVLSIEISRDLLIMATIFIAVGIFNLIKKIFKKEEICIQINFSIFSIAFFCILLVNFLFIKSFNPARVYHSALCFLSPFVVIGFAELCKYFKRIKKSKNNLNNPCVMDIYSEKYIRIFAIFLAIFLLFNTGVISETITRNYGDYSPNIIISKPRALNIKDTQYLKSFYSTYLFDQEVFSAQWLYRVRVNSTKFKIYMDNPGAGIFLDLMGPGSIAKCYVYVKNRSDVKRGYIYLSTLNIQRNVAIVNLYPPKVKNLSEVYPLNTTNKIYTNGESDIYATSNIILSNNY